MRSLLPLQTTGSSCIDIMGLNKQDRERVMAIGLDAWLDELLSNKPRKRKQNVVVPTNSSRVLLPGNQSGSGTTENRQQQVNDSDLVSKLKAGSVGYSLALQFFRLARENNNIVTYKQTTELCPNYPGDPALWAREAGAEVRTERKLKRYVVVKYA